MTTSRSGWKARERAAAWLSDPHPQDPARATGYDVGVGDGLRMAVALVRAGCSPDDVASLAPPDRATTAPSDYQSELGELRRILRNDSLCGGEA